MPKIRGTERMTTKQYREQVLGQRTTPKAPGKSKMRNKIVVLDGIRFDSLLEGGHYLYLLHQIKTGQVRYFVRQVPFDCGGGVTYKLDFMVLKTDGTIDHIDDKGHRTPEYRNKKKQVEARYPIKIIEVTRKDIPVEYINTARDLNQLNYAGEK